MDLRVHAIPVTETGHAGDNRSETLWNLYGAVVGKEAARPLAVLENPRAKS
jgi:hypothetical protein